MVSSALAVLVLGFLALQIRNDSRVAVENEVQIYCAAGLAEPIEKMVAAFNAKNGTRASVARIGGSGELAGQIKMEFATEFTRGADLFVSADFSLIEVAQRDGAAQSVFPLAQQSPVIAANWNTFVEAGSLKDLVSTKLRYGIASEHAAIGKQVRSYASEHGFLHELESNKALEAENVMTLAQALVTGSIDVAILWDTTVAQVNQSFQNKSGKELEEQADQTIKIIRPVDPSGELRSMAAIAVLRNPDKATSNQSVLELARFLSSSKTSRKILGSLGYEEVRSAK